VGLLVGRTAWRAATNGLGAVTDAAAPWAVIATVLPVAVLAGLGAAWWPGWRVGRRRPAETLHVE
jgi:predicted membrane-bound mannosyltransferase